MSAIDDPRRHPYHETCGPHFPGLCWWCGRPKDEHEEGGESMAQPDIVFKHGACHAAVFSKEVTRGEKTFQVCSVSFQKRYLDKNGEWQTASYLDVNDLPKAALVLSKAFDYLTSGGHREEESEE